MDKDETFVRKFAMLQEAVMQQRSNEDYELNEENYKKYKAVKEYFTAFAKKENGTIKCYELVPKERCAYISVIICILTVTHEDLKIFIEILSKIDVFSIDACVDGNIEIGININDVFVECK